MSAIEIINQIINIGFSITYSIIILCISLYALAAIWKWFIGISMKFIHWLNPIIPTKKNTDK